MPTAYQIHKQDGLYFITAQVVVPNIPNYSPGAVSGSPCDTLTGITNIKQQENAFTPYPNPFSDRISITVQHSSNKPAELIISDLLGQEIYNQKISLTNQLLNLSFLTEGIYFITLKTSSNSFSQKVIKLNGN